jgi:hypothetical protein
MAERMAALYRHGRAAMLAKLLPLTACATVVWSAAIAQTKCQSPPTDMTCPGDMLVWGNLPSKIYPFQGEHYFGCTKTGKFMCRHDNANSRPWKRA